MQRNLAICKDKNAAVFTNKLMCMRNSLPSVRARR